MGRHPAGGPRRRAWCPPASARATRFASKRRCGSTATTWTKRPRCVEADLGWIVGWKKDAFIGADVLRRQKAEGAPRKLVGFEMLERAIGRHGYDVYLDGGQAGVVTSGTQTPFLKKAIGMAYLPADRTQPGTEFEVDVRGRRARASVVPMPFYKRAK